eukprot:gb/GECG01016734.1/.p1 GENE.gb/GECG01016734.1/~~gb/GECG01016734.1/.p1  ORF type:complete len:140 (+),score=22.74 gb/GECG01016734.1/:1-420(+)
MAEEGKTQAAETAPVQSANMDPMEALKSVMHSSLVHNGLRRGLREATKAIDRKAARICCLAKDCDEPSYVKLVKALCEQRGIPIMMVPAGKTLGEWSGLCKVDEEGNPKKVVSCSCCVITDYGEKTPALDALLNHVKKA